MQTQHRNRKVVVFFISVDSNHRRKARQIP